jgi:hypothetical protein
VKRQIDTKWARMDNYWFQQHRNLHYKERKPDLTAKEKSAIIKIVLPPQKYANYVREQERLQQAQQQLRDRTNTSSAPPTNPQSREGTANESSHPEGGGGN